MKNLIISDNQVLLDLDVIHQYLSCESYWAKGISKQLVKQSIENSLSIGAYINNQQVGFCRIISDFTTFANLVDVFIITEYRGLGIAKKLMQFVFKHQKLQNLRRFMLATKDAHQLYKNFGFETLNKPETIMQRYYPDIYLKL